MPTNVRVTIYDRNLDALFLAGGDVWNWMERVGREHLAEALIEVPRRSGVLASAHNLALTPYQKRGTRYSVGNYAEHAEYVYFGTTGPITTGGGFWDNGKIAYLGPMAPWMGRNTRFAPSVSGQESNPWVANAADHVLAKYGYVGNAYPTG